MTMPRGTDMFHPISDELFDKMTAGYSPEFKACKRAGLDFFNSIMALNIADATASLSQMRKSVQGIGENLAMLAMAQSLSDKPADITLPVGQIMNAIAREREAKEDAALGAPKSLA